jgi:hypothetical protein
MTIAVLTAVVLANAGTPFLHALPDSAREWGPRIREDDGLKSNPRIREESLPHKSNGGITELGVPP